MLKHVFDGRTKQLLDRTFDCVWNRRVDRIVDLQRRFKNRLFDFRPNIANPGNQPPNGVHEQKPASVGIIDAAAGKIYAAAYGKSPEFYGFYRSLQAYRNALGKEGDVMVVAPEGEFFKYLKAPGRR